jgi:hypothetical protein
MASHGPAKRWDVEITKDGLMSISASPSSMIFHYGPVLIAKDPTFHDEIPNYPLVIEHGQ